VLELVTLLVDNPAVELVDCELVDSPAVDELDELSELVLNPSVDGELVLMAAVELDEFSELVLMWSCVELLLDELSDVLDCEVVSPSVLVLDGEDVLSPAVLLLVVSPSVELVDCEDVVSGSVMLELLLFVEDESVDCEDVLRFTVLELERLEVLLLLLELLELDHSAAAATMPCQIAAPSVWSMHDHASPRLFVQTAPVRNGRPMPAVSTLSWLTPGWVVSPG